MDDIQKLCLETIEKGKQAIVFVPSRASAEKTAEQVSKLTSLFYPEFKEQVLKAASSPTRQCKRLGSCVHKGVAFHHAGLLQKQKDLIEEEFKNGKIKIIACTPSLAAGVNLPAFRVIIKSLKRFSNWGMDWIPVLEYLQMCLPYKQKIITSKGNLEIGKIVEKKIKEKILTFNTNTEKYEFKKITKYHKRQTNNLIEITTKKGYKLKLTEEHPLFVNKKWKKAKEIEIGDELFLTKYYNNISLPPDFVDLIPKNKTYIENKGELITLVVEKLNITEKELAKRYKLNYKCMYHYKKNKKAMPFSFFLNLCKILKIDKKGIVQEIKSKNGSIIKIPKKINEDIMWLAGIIASDGNIHRTVDKRSKSEYIKIRLGNTNIELIKEFERIIQKLSNSKLYRSKRRHNFYQTETGNSLLARILGKNFGLPFKNKTSKVKVPPFLFNCSKKLIGAYIAGVFDGDGCYTKTQNKRFNNTFNHRICFVTASKLFAQDLQDLLLKIGVVSKLEVDKKAKTHTIRGEEFTFGRTKYYINVHKKKDIINFSKYVKPIKYKIDIAIYSHYNNLSIKYDQHSDHEKVKVKIIKRINLKNPIDVYNISVADNENYFASNLLVHNCGRAGRPQYSTEGQSVVVAKNSAEKDEIYEKYVCGEPEEIYSKLAVEPVLRMYVLSLVSSGIVRDETGLKEFFGKTFWAHQFEDMAKLESIMEKMIRLLQEWKFIEGKSDTNDFVAADALDSKEVRVLRPTRLGKRVSELYLDPLTAKHLLDCMERFSSEKDVFSILQMISNTLEMRPLLRIKAKEEEFIQQELVKNYGLLLMDEPSAFDFEYNDFMNSIKTALFFSEWIEEKEEDFLLEKFNIRPGEIRVKNNSADWLLYACEELGGLLEYRELVKEVRKLRVRIKHGVKEEVLPMLKLKGVGRVRARKLFTNGIRDLGGIKKVDVTSLTQIVGSKLAVDLKKQVGVEVKEIISPKKRIGQMSLTKF